MKKRTLALLSTAFFVGMTVPIAIAHHTGHESRTIAECEKLPTPERQNCVKCVTRHLKHHFHPDYPPAERCRPDNGKP